MELEKDGQVGFLVKFLSFMYPIFGLIMYIVWRKDRPIDANKVAKVSLISVTIALALAIMWFVFGGALFFSVMRNTMLYMH